MSGCTGVKRQWRESGQRASVHWAVSRNSSARLFGAFSFLSHLFALRFIVKTRMQSTCALMVFSFLSCTGDKNTSTKEQTVDRQIALKERDTADSLPTLDTVPFIDTLEQRLIDAGLIDIQTVAPSILVDLKYSTEDNFMQKDMYGTLSKAYLQPDVAEDLAMCQALLKEKDTSLSLLVYDAVRPRLVQQYMWDVLDMPIREKVKFVSNPKNGSVHNYGCAVDLTIATTAGVPLDMGAEYDDSRKIAYPRHEESHLRTGLLQSEQVANRRLLRSVMRRGGFRSIATEWWHFNRYPRHEAKKRYTIIE